MNHAKKKWAIATNSMSLEVSTTNPMYTTELYKSVTVTEDSSGFGKEGKTEDGERSPSVGEVETGTEGEVETGTDAVEFEEDWSQKWISIENSL